MNEVCKVIYTPKILTSLRDICHEFAVGERCVRKWIREGAPIAVRGTRNGLRYSAELMQLHNWLLNGRRKTC